MKINTKGKVILIAIIMGFMLLCNNQVLAEKFPGSIGKESEGTKIKKDLKVNQEYVFDTRALWYNPYLYCIQPQYELKNNSKGTVTKEHYINTKTGIRTNVNTEKELLMANTYAYLSSDNDTINNVGKEDWDYDEYLKTNPWQHIIWMSRYAERKDDLNYFPTGQKYLPGEYYRVDTVCDRLPWTNIVTKNGERRKAWHFYDKSNNYKDMGEQAALEFKVLFVQGVLRLQGFTNINEIKNNKDIKISDQEVKVNYDSSKTELKSFENFIIIGPFNITNTRKSDELKRISIKYKKNGKTETRINLSKNDDIKFIFEEYKWNDKVEVTGKEWKEDYSGSMTDMSGKFYIAVNKNAGVTNIDEVNMNFERVQLEAKWWDIEIAAGQNLEYGWGKTYEESINVKVEVPNLIPPVQVELDKVDTAGDAVEGAKFSIEYSNGLKGETKTVGKDGKIVFSQVQPTSPDEFTATITETFTPAGYKKLEKPIVLKFTYDQTKAVWKVEKISGPDEKIEIKETSKDSKSGINKIPVTVENKSIIEKLTLSKISSVKDGEKVEGAKFKLTLTNIASIKGYKIPTTGTPTIIVTTDKNGNIVLEDIEIADLSKDIVITMEETEAPVGYKKIEGKITVTLKRKGNTYTIHKAEKEDTVTEDEFKAGEVTLINHELVLNIKDIPIMNLGGIVWTEKIKTGKEQSNINNTYSKGDDEALGGVTVRLLDENDEPVATTKTAEKDGQEVTYLNNLGKEGTVKLKQGQYLFTKLDDGTNYIPVGTDYKVEIDYDGITYNPLINPDTSMLYKNKEENKGVFSKITSEQDHGLAAGTKTIFGTENETQSKTNGGYTINYTLPDEKEKNIPDKAIYSNVEKDGKQAFVTARSEKYLQKTEDWKSTWKDNNGVGEINLDSYAFDINFGLYKKFFDLNLGTDVEKAEVEINGQKTEYTYDQILDGMLDEDLKEKLYKTTDDKADYNLYLAYSDYYYRIDDYKVPGDTENGESLGQPYGEALTNKKNTDTQLQVYVTYKLQINNQSTQHNATGVKVKYSYDEGYEYVGSNGEATVSDEGHNILTISNINNVVSGEPKEITLKFKVKKNNDGTFVKAPSDTSKYTNMAEIIEYSTEEGRLVDADSAPGNTFLGENNPTDRREDDTDTANGIVITFKKNAERSISGKVFEDSDKNSTQNGEEQAINDVIVQLIELVESNNKQYEYIWQETVAGSNTVKTTDRNGYPGKIYEYKKSDDENPSGKMVEQEINGEAGYCIYVDGTNSDGQYKFVNIIPGNYIVRFIYGDGSTYDITENTLKYNGEDYKSTYVDYNYNAEWYNNTSLNGKNSKAVDNEARRLKVMSYAVNVNGTKGAELALLSKPRGTDDEKLKAVLDNTWMCAETLKIKVPVAPSVLVDENGEKEEKLSITENSTSVKKAESQDNQYKVTFDNVNLGLMERPKTKLVLEKHITGLTIKPVASGVNLIANATADINKILEQGEGNAIQLEGQQDGLFAQKSGRTNRGQWYLQTDTTELAQGADAYITYTYVIKNEGDTDYLSKDLIEFYKNNAINDYVNKLSNLETEVKNAKKQVTGTGTAYTNGTYISNFYYTKNVGENDAEVLASVEQIQEALNPKVTFVNSTTDFSKTDNNSTSYYDKNGILQPANIKETITSTKGTDKLLSGYMDLNKKLVVSVGLSASEIENGGVYDSYIAQVTHYTNAAGRRDQSTPDNLSYVHSEDPTITLDSENPATNKKYNEQDEFWAETFRITKPTGEDKITPVQIAIITISAVAVLGIGIILIKKFVLKK